MCSNRGGLNGPDRGDAELPPSRSRTGRAGGPSSRAGAAGEDEAALRAASGIRRLGEAIDALAEAVRAGQEGEVSPVEVAGRLASIWEMIADLDPAVAVRLPGYSPRTE